MTDATDVQHGLDPIDWKPVDAVGPGMKEIRVRDVTGAFRVLYVAKFKAAIYVLHCFQKKTEETNEREIKSAEKRYGQLLRELAP